MLSFKSFLLEGDFGITHLEDLPIETFIRLLKRLPQLTIVQKLDGANLVFGIDRAGKLYTSREQKGGERFYKPSDFPSHSAFDGFRTAHQVLQKVEPTLAKLVKPGTAVSCEVLFGDQPNTVLYGKDNLSYIAFLEQVEGDDPTLKLDPELPAKLYSALAKEHISLESKVSDTSDGITMVKAPTVTQWGFSKSDSVDPAVLARAKIGSELSQLEKFLNKTNHAAEDAGFDLTNFEVLKHKSTKLKDARDKLHEQLLKSFVMPIKAKLLAEVDKLKPSLRGNEATDKATYKGIEGIILTDPETGERFKIVDRERFSAVNKFNYKVRNDLTGRIVTSKQDADLSSRGGLVGQAKIRCLRLFGIPGIEVPAQAKRMLGKFVGGSKAETIKNLAGTTKSLNFPAIKRKIGAVLISSLHDLEDKLQDFKEHGNRLELKLDDGQRVKYTPEIRRRTLMTFAEAHKTLSKLLANVRKASDTAQLLQVFLDGTLDDLQQQAQEEEE